MEKPQGDELFRKEQRYFGGSDGLPSPQLLLAQLVSNQTMPLTHLWKDSVFVSLAKGEIYGA